MENDNFDGLNSFMETVLKLGLGGLVGLKKRDDESEEDFNKRVSKRTNELFPNWRDYE